MEFFRGVFANPSSSSLDAKQNREGPSAGGSGGHGRRRYGRPRVRPRRGKGRGDRGGAREMLTTGEEGRQGGRQPSTAADGGARWRRCSGGIPATGSGGVSSARCCDARGGVGFTRRSSVAANRGGLQTPVAALHRAADGLAARLASGGGAARSRLGHGRAGACGSPFIGRGAAPGVPSAPADGGGGMAWPPW
jgi:hypothetical protein